MASNISRAGVLFRTVPAVAAPLREHGVHAWACGSCIAAANHTLDVGSMPFTVDGAGSDRPLTPVLLRVVWLVDFIRRHRTMLLYYDGNMTFVITMRYPS